MISLTQGCNPLKPFKYNFRFAKYIVHKVSKYQILYHTDYLHDSIDIFVYQ